MEGQLIKRTYKYPNKITLPETGAVINPIDQVIISTIEVDGVSKNYVSGTSSISGTIDKKAFNFNLQEYNTTMVDGIPRPTANVGSWPYGIELNKIMEELIAYIESDVE